MPHVADSPRQTEAGDDFSSRALDFPAPEGSVWEDKIASLLRSYNLSAEPSTATPKTLHARVLISVMGTRLYGGPLEKTSVVLKPLTWVQEAEFVIPRSRSLTSEEQTAYRQFRLRKFRRV